MKRIGIAVLVAIAAIAMIPVVSGGEVEPIKNFKVVTDLPSTMYPGSTYGAHYRFDSIADELVLVLTLLSIEGPDIGLGGWSISATVNEANISVLENDENAGNFILSYEVAARSTNDVILQVSLPLDAPPAIYTFTMELWSERVKIYPSEEPEEVPLEEPEVPPEKVPEEPPEKLPTGGIRVTDALSSEQNWQVVFVAAIGALGVATMLCVKSFTTKPKKSKKG